MKEMKTIALKANRHVNNFFEFGILLAQILSCRWVDYTSTKCMLMFLERGHNQKSKLIVFEEIVCCIKKINLIEELYFFKNMLAFKIEFIFNFVQNFTFTC